MKLHEIKDKVGAKSNSKRLGRGEGSGKGKTCGKGHKGQKARSGVAIKGFEGGQNPIYMRLPKRGFNNSKFKIVYSLVGFDDLQNAIDNKLIDSTKPITIKELRDGGLIAKKATKVKLLSNGSLKTAVDLVVDKASESALSMMKKLKGTVTLSK